VKKASALLLAAFLAGPALASRAASPGLEKAVRSLADKLLKSAQPGSSIAVPAFSAPAAPAGLGRAVAEALAEELLRSGRFTVVEGDYLEATGRAPADLGGADYVVEGSVAPSGRKKLELQARLLAAATGPLLASAKTSIKNTEAVPGAAPVQQPAVTILNGPGPASCSWIHSRVTAPGRTAALLLARGRSLGAVMSLPRPHTPDLGAEALRGKEGAVLQALRSGRVVAEQVTAEGAAGEGYALTLRSCVNAAGLSKDKGFTVELTLNQRRFFAGQGIRFRAVSNRDGFLHFFRTDLAGRLLPRAPEDPEAGARVIANRASEARGFPAVVPPGETASAAILRVLAVRRDIQPLLAGTATYPELLRKLDESGAEWAEDVRILTVYPQPR